MIKRALKDRDLEEEWGFALDLTNLKLLVVRTLAAAKVVDGERGTRTNLI